MESGPNPYIHEAHVHFGSNFKPELPRHDQTQPTVMLEGGKVYQGIETRSKNVGSSIPHLVQVSGIAEGHVQYTSVHIETEDGKAYHLKKVPREHIWTVATSDHPDVAEKIDVAATGPFVVGHEFHYVQKEDHAARVTKKVKHITILNKAVGVDVPEVGTGGIETDGDLIHKVKSIKIDPHAKDPEHVQRTITLFDGKEIGYVAGYRQHERHEGVHMHATRNELTILEGHFEVCIFDKKTWQWGPRRIYGKGETFRLEPKTPHLIAPAEDPMHPFKLSIIKIVTDRWVDIAPGQGYNIPLPSDTFPPLPPLEHHGLFRRHSG